MPPWRSVPVLKNPPGLISAITKPLTRHEIHWSFIHVIVSVDKSPLNGRFQFLPTHSRGRHFFEFVASPAQEEILMCSHNANFHNRRGKPEYCRETVNSRNFLPFFSLLSLARLCEGGWKDTPNFCVPSPARGWCLHVQFSPCAVDTASFDLNF